VSSNLPLILVVEDEPQMRRFLRATLGSHDFGVVEAASAAEAIAHATAYNPDVVLLDLGLPDGDGLEITKRVREWSSTPIIVVSARGREADKIEALDAGADDYLTKPFDAGELLARIRVALRHRARVSPDSVEQVFVLGGLKVDLARRVVTRDGAEVRLTPHEYKLLAALVHNAGKVMTHRQLLLEVWGPNAVKQSHYLRVYMAQLRHKLEEQPARPRYFITEPGVGYRLKTEVR
jgi:two-component system, OmpR family, KDP operon response regulator KdpE